MKNETQLTRLRSNHPDPSAIVIPTEEEFEELGEHEQDRDEEWYLDENGYRLESEALFAASPWSLETPDGEVKLLQRFCKNGVTHFDTLNGYGGETFRWLHSRSPS